MPCRIRLIFHKREGVLGVIYSLSYFYAVISVLPYAYGEWGIGLVVALVAVGREHHFRKHFIVLYFRQVDSYRHGCRLSGSQCPGFHLIGKQVALAVNKAHGVGIHIARAFIMHPYLQCGVHPGQRRVRTGYAGRFQVVVEQFLDEEVVDICPILVGVRVDVYPGIVVAAFFSRVNEFALAPVRVVLAQGEIGHGFHFGFRCRRFCHEQPQFLLRQQVHAVDSRVETDAVVVPCLHFHRRGYHVVVGLVSVAAAVLQIARSIIVGEICMLPVERVVVLIPDSPKLEVLVGTEVLEVGQCLARPGHDCVGFCRCAVAGLVGDDDAV